MPGAQTGPVAFGQYALARALATIAHSFSVDQNLHSTAAFGSLYYRMVRRHRERTQHNLRLSFPDWDEEHVADVAERSIQYMFKLFMVDSMVTPRLVTTTSWPRYIQFNNIAPLLERLVSGEPTILVSGHVGNWELLGHSMAVLGYPIAALARPLDNRYLNRWLMDIREAWGMRIITKWGATGIVQDVLRQSGRIGFIADQNAGDEGLFVPFFGRLASSYKSIGLLAMRYRVPIAAGWARRIGSELRYEISVTDFIRPEEWEDQPDPLFYITAKYNHAFERMIRSAPDQYLWVHRRWKSRPPHERRGRPVPQRLIEKLQSLPWLSTEDVDLIVERSNRAAAENARAD